MKKIYICLLLIFYFTNGKAQTPGNSTDSLRQQLSFQKTGKDSIRVLEQLVMLDFYTDVYASIGNVHIHQLLTINNRLKIINAYPYQLLLKGSQFTESKKYRQALDTYIMAVHEFDKQHKVIVELLMSIRIYYNLLNDPDGRLKFYSTQLEYYLVNGPVKNTAPCYHGIAGYYRLRAAYNQSLNYYFKAAEIFRRFDIANYANDIAVVGDLYGDWGNEAKGMYYLNKALPIIKSVNDSDNVAYCDYAISRILTRDGKFTASNSKIAEAFNYDTKTSKEYTGDYLVQQSFNYISLNQLKPAITSLKQAAAIRDSGSFNIINTAGDFEVDYGFYLYYLKTGNYKAAETALLVAYKEAIKEKSSTLQLKYLKCLAELYQLQQQPQLAINNYNHYFELLAQTQQGESQFKVAQYEIDQNDKQQREHINQLKQEKILQDYQISRRNALLWFSLVIVLLITGLLIFIYRQLRINKRTVITLRKTQKQLIQSEKMASLGELTAGIAHEIQNPLNFVNNFSEVSVELVDEMQDELNNGDKAEAIAISEYIKQNLEKIRHHGKRADAIVKGMLQHSRASSNTKEPTDINKLADEYLRLAYHGLRAKDKSFNAELVTNFAANLPLINVVPQDIGRVLLNLFTNAFYATQQKKLTVGDDYKPTVAITTYTSPSGGWGISVKDNGNGIPDSIKDKIMQPFFTTKPTGEGTGLGLSLSYDILVKGHGGTIQVNSIEVEGSEFIIQLPVN